jgi:hypothetical protein
MRVSGMIDDFNSDRSTLIPIVAECDSGTHLDDLNAGAEIVVTIAGIWN